jgi:hypothetical protein
MLVMATNLIWKTVEQRNVLVELNEVLHNAEESQIHILVLAHILEGIVGKITLEDCRCMVQNTRSSIGGAPMGNSGERKKLTEALGKGTDTLTH